MPTIACLNKGDVRVRRNLPSRLRCNADERIIRRIQHQCRHRDSIDYVRSRSAVIVIVDAREAAIVSRYLVIKLTQTSDAMQPANVEVWAEKTRFLKHPATKCPQEICFVDSVRWLVQCVRRRREINRGTTGCDRANAEALAIPTPPPTSERCCPPWRSQPAPVATRRRV